MTYQMTYPAPAETRFADGAFQRNLGRDYYPQGHLQAVAVTDDGQEAIFTLRWGDEPMVSTGPSPKIGLTVHAWRTREDGAPQLDDVTLHHLLAVTGTPTDTEYID